MKYSYVRESPWYNKNKYTGCQIYIYTGVSVSELFGYRDPPFSDPLSEQILSELFDPRGLVIGTSSDTETTKGSRYPNSKEQWFAIRTNIIRTIWS